MWRNCQAFLAEGGRRRSVIGGGKNSDQDGQESEVENNLATAGHQTRGSVISDEEGTRKASVQA